VTASCGPVSPGFEDWRKGQPAHCVIICFNSFRTSSISLLTANKARDIFARQPIRNRPAIQTPVTVVVFLTTKRQPVFPAGYSSYSTAPTHLLLTPPKPVATTFPPPPRHAPSSALPADYPFDLATAEPASSENPLRLQTSLGSVAAQPAHRPLLRLFLHASDSPRMSGMPTGSLVTPDQIHRH
jgi:hypothetical protein